MKSSNIITHNWWLKLISIAFAIILWLIVVNINDPSTSQTYYNVPVTIQNTDVITSQGKIYEVEDNTDIVPRVTVYGPRSVLETMDKSSIVAVADMNNLSSVNTISIDFSTNTNNNQISDIRGSIEAVKVTIENKKTIQLVLDTSITGEAPDGYVIGGVNTDQNLVRVSGPESLVDRVTTAQVSIDMNTLSGVTSDITTSAAVHLYDEEGAEVTGTTLAKNPENVIATISVLGTKDVPVEVTPSGVPAEGYAMSGDITTTPATIKIAGTKKALASISAIQIPEDVVNITGQSADFVAQLDVTEYLPEGITLVEPKDGALEVDIKIEKATVKEVTYTDKDIKVTGVPDGYTVSILTEELPVKFIGAQTEVNALDEKAALQTIDLTQWMEEQGITELTEGQLSISPAFVTPEDIQVEHGTVTLEVLKKEE